MTNNYGAKAKTLSEEQKSVFIMGMFRIKEFHGIPVEEYSLRFFKTDPMLLFVNRVFVIVPRKMQPIHNYNVIAL